METHLADHIRDSDVGREAEAILRACVHCGFCGATCPTYQLLGDELDSPRGRIYQIKEVLEGKRPTRATQVHLDRCLTCLSCETTCPSGVRFGRLLEIGRSVVDQSVARPLLERFVRATVRETVSRRVLFGGLLRVARALRQLLPARIQVKFAVRRSAGSIPSSGHARRVILLTSCTQGALLPAVDYAAARVLDRLGVAVVVDPTAGCCGALRAHLSDLEGARVAARRNVDAWWPQVEAGVEALVMTASGCGLQVRDYGRLLAAEPAYAERAARLSALTLDLSVWLAREWSRLPLPVVAMPPVTVAFHAPCSLQHGQQINGVVEPLLVALGARLATVREAHLCCGSAGSYSLLQQTLSAALRKRKISALTAGAPEVILSANVGCLAHLEPATAIPVRHWIEWLDERLSQALN
ncbi:MAG: glycolate oxidase subunit GlcF [Proteobacteria bacterium]|nr:glycolate oxidase subunit GlcF [Pseudomonadota bacterium]